MWALKIWLLFKLLALITFYSNIVRPQNFLGLLIIYLALQHFLQNPNTTFQHWDMSQHMTWGILAHIPYFRRPSHILWAWPLLSFMCIYWFIVNFIHVLDQLIYKLSILYKQYSGLADLAGWDWWRWWSHLKHESLINHPSNVNKTWECTDWYACILWAYTDSWSNGYF